VLWIDRDADLGEAVAALSGAPSYFIDTEFESTRKQTTLSVIQLSAGREIFLFDALKLSQLGPLGEVLFRSDAEWVLHAGLQDVDLLLKRFGKSDPPRLFDTQIAWSLVSAEANVSLIYLQYVLLNLRSMKSHQADDWMRRPLPPSQLEYAAADIEHLPELHQRLGNQLTALDRREMVYEVSRELLQPRVEPMAELSMKSFRNAWQLEPPNQAALRALVRWYNGLSPRERTRAPQTKTLLSIAVRLPRNSGDLSRIKGVPAGFAHSSGRALVSLMQDAVDNARRGDFEQIDPAPYATFDDILWDAWIGGLRAKVCAELHVSPELAFPNRVVSSWREQLKQHGESYAPELLDGWRKTLFSDAVRRYADDSSHAVSGGG
jgi:ribonuclease D